MDKLDGLADSLTTKLEIHEGRLEQVQQKVEQVQDYLNSAALTAGSFRSSLATSFSLRGWWPYVFCPAASLIMGSYGLPPSIMRNLWLLSIGWFSWKLEFLCADHNFRRNYRFHCFECALLCQLFHLTIYLAIFESCDTKYYVSSRSVFIRIQHARRSRWAWPNQIRSTLLTGYHHYALGIHHLGHQVFEVRIWKALSLGQVFNDRSSGKVGLLWESVI